MKKFLKITCLLTIVSFANITFAKDKSTIMMSGEKQGFALDFLNVDGITGLQFDVSLNGVNPKSVSLKSCVSGLSKSHVGACQFVKNGNLRVIIFSPSNAILDSGNIGTLKLNGAALQGAEISKVTMVRPDLKEISGDILVDISRTKPLIQNQIHK
jgi:hypothetical protein